MRRLFLLPRYQRDAAKLLGAEEQDEMERYIADDRSVTRLFQEAAEVRRPGRSVFYRRICQEREGES